MKLLAINAYHYRKGGSETVYFNSAQLFRQNGHEVSFFALKWPQNEPSEFGRYFAESKETRRGPFSKIANISNYFYHSEAARKLDELIDDCQPDVALIHLIWGQLTPSILKVLRKRGIPAVLVAHDYRLVCPDYLFYNGRGEVCEQCRNGNFLPCIKNRCCQKSLPLSAMMAAEQYFREAFFTPVDYLSGIVYVSRFSQFKHLEHNPKLGNVPSLVLHNFSPWIADEVSEKKDCCLFLGRLSREKGVATMLEAFARCPEQRLLIAGAGPDEPALRQMAARLNMNNVEFLGFKTGADKARLVAEARFTIVPSECFENNPMSIIESYSSGTPVIGSRVGGIPELVEEGSTGFLFTPGDVQSLAEVLTRAGAVTAAEYSAMAGAALEYARAGFSEEPYYKALDAFLEKVIAQRAF